MTIQHPYRCVLTMSKINSKVPDIRAQGNDPYSRARQPMEVNPDMKQMIAFSR